MKAVRLVKTGHPLELQEIPTPTIGQSDALIRVKAAGICHSDAHYRAGRSPVGAWPITPGHEVAGVIEEIGRDVTELRLGDRVCVHYLSTCGKCNPCRAGIEQFCPSGAMIGKHRDGGYAEYLAMPTRSLFRLPEEIPFAIGAIMMCSSATAFHALKKARLKPGESVAVFGLGGLGISAIQLAKGLGAGHVFGVDIKQSKLALAQNLGITAIDASKCDAVREIGRLTDGHGVDVALELIGLPATMRQAVLCLGIQGRAALAGITEQPIHIHPYQELLGKEAEIIGVSDHLAAELPGLISMVRDGRLNLSSALTRTIDLEAGAINDALDELERFGDSVRTVIVL